VNHTLPRSIGFRELLVFLLLTGFAARFIASAATLGPSALVIWFLGCAVFYVPLALCVVELSSRYPQEGGLYVWSKQAFGDYVGYLTGWAYWTSNLIYFPAVLYFTAGNALFIGGWQSFNESQPYFIVFSLLGLGLATAINVRGLKIGRWLFGFGALSSWGTALTLVVLGGIVAFRFGAATSFTWESLVPATGWKDLVLWSAVAFALCGAEAVAVMGDEIRDSRKNLPRAMLLAGILITATYMLGTVGLLVALPVGEISNIQGLMQAVTAVTERLGLWGVSPAVALMITITGLGQVGAWLATVSRLPFVAGVDHFLPPAFARLHPRWQTPHVALWFQAAVAAVFVFLGQLGTSVKGAYDVLLSMGVISAFVPYLLMFAALIRLQRLPAGPEIVRPPGGKAVSVGVGVIGLLSTAASMVLAALPPESEPNPWLSAAKVVVPTLILLSVGSLLYRFGKRNKPARSALSGKALLP
jgi:amino acid transporter